MLLNCQYFLKFFTSFFFSFFIILLLAKIAFFFLNRFDERYTLNSLKRHVIFIFLSTPKAELSESQNEEINEIYDGEYEQNRIKYTEFVTGKQGNVFKNEKIIGDDDKNTENDDDENLYEQNDENNHKTYQYEKKRVGRG